MTTRAASRGRPTPISDPLLSVVMPVYNEIATLEEMVGRGLAVPIRIELIAVDDCSKDGSRERLQALAAERGFQVLLQDRNQGKGMDATRSSQHSFTGS